MVGAKTKRKKQVDRVVNGDSKTAKRKILFLVGFFFSYSHRI